jgi:predicted porin
MKKSLIALAALAAVGAVSAQSSVTMYGRMDLGWGTATTKAANGTQDKTTGLVDGVQTSSAIGFRGTEDLGGGLIAGFNLEQGYSATQSNGWNMRTGSSGHQVTNGGAMSTGTMREGNLSLRGGFGLVQVGTLQWSAGYTVASRWGMFAEGFGGGEAHTTMPARITGLSWTSPVMSNTTVTLQHGSAHGQRTDRESAADAADGLRKNKEARTGFNIQHTAGPLYLGAAYESTAVDKIANAAATTNAYGGTVAAGSTANRTEKAWTVAANYDFGVAVLRGMMVERDNGAATAVKTSGRGVSVAVPMGALTLAVATGMIEVKTGGTTTSDVSGHQLTARYNLSKRTNMYIHYGTDKDSANTSATTQTSKRTRTIAGLVHTF